MNAIVLNDTNFDGRSFHQKAKKRARILFHSDTYKVIFAPKYIKVGSNQYDHPKWLKFSFSDMKQMPGLEVQFWSKWGLYFSKLLEMYNKKCNN